jgi:hypothetical protein
VSKKEVFRMRTEQRRADRGVVIVVAIAVLMVWKPGD